MPSIFKLWIDPAGLGYPRQYPRTHHPRPCPYVYVVFVVILSSKEHLPRIERAS